jgi:hypothetical protein
MQPKTGLSSARKVSRERFSFDRLFFIGVSSLRDPFGSLARTVPASGAPECRLEDGIFE